MLRGAGFDIRRLDTEPCHIPLKRGDHSFCQPLVRNSLIPRPLKDFIVNVRNIPDIKCLQTFVPKEAREDIEHYHNPAMADVTVVIDRDTTNIKLYPARLQRGQDLLGLGKRVAKPDHGFNSFF